VAGIGKCFGLVLRLCEGVVVPGNIAQMTLDLREYLCSLGGISLFPIGRGWFVAFDKSLLFFQDALAEASLLVDVDDA
jgi:hypothetical protein